MNAVPPSFRSGLAAGSGPDEIAAMRWAAVLEAANVVATLAGHAPDRPDEAARTFPDRLARADVWRRERARHGITDLAAVLEPGIAALLAVNARGADSRPAAAALWREFTAARDAVLALVPEADARRRV